ncbi:MAG: transcriptional regulator [Candidatus Hydrogenedentes bacterium]|nr:transcriptional regulator [Candidatus Hydrogenedentota bacterium]
MPENGAQDTARTLNLLDPLLMHKGRLGICALLARADALSFSRLKELLEESDGNLGAQLRKLEEGGYITVKKEFVNRKPVSWYALQESGRTAMTGHLSAIAALIESGSDGGSPE